MTFLTIVGLLLLCGSTGIAQDTSMTGFAPYYERIDDGSNPTFASYSIGETNVLNTFVTGLATTYGNEYDYQLFDYNYSNNGLVRLWMYCTGTQAERDVFCEFKFLPLYESSLVDSPYFDMLDTSSGWTSFVDARNTYLVFTFSDSLFNTYTFTYNLKNDISELSSEDQVFGYEKVEFSLCSKLKRSSFMSNNKFSLTMSVYTTKDNGNSYNEGYSQGFEDGKASAENIPSTDLNFGNYLFSIFDVPLYIVRSMFDYNVYGINIFGALLSILSVIIVVGVIRRVIH